MRLPATITLLACAAVAAALSVPADADPQDTAPDPMDTTRYHSHQEVGAFLQAWAAHSDLATLKVMGRSREGRELWVIEIHNPATGPADEKPAVYIDGNTHGNEIQGTEVCMYTVQELLGKHGEDPYLTDLVDRLVFLIAPTVNPDGRTHFLEDPSTPHSFRWNMRPTDNDRDGLVDEDPYDDLDGDGSIVSMRRRNPDGGWTTDPEDPRIMRRVEPGERGEWEMLGSEGIDNDGDGRINEDGPGGVDLNRNFPTQWAPPHRQFGAGPYPLSEPETRATVEYLLQWPNLAAAQSYHNFGEMVLRPPAYSGDREAGVPRRDVQLYDILGERGERMIPGYRYLQTHDGLYPVRGGFLDWTYDWMGAWTFTNELWNMGEDYDGDGNISEAERLQWNDEMLLGRGFIEWHEVEHPDLGTVELGGWHKLARRCPPAFELPDTIYRNHLFTLFHAEALGRAAIAGVRVRPVEGAGRLYTVDVKVANDGLLDTSTHMSVRRGRHVPETLTLRGDGIEVMSAGILDTVHGRVDLPDGDAADRPVQPFEVGIIRGGDVKTVRFLVSGGGAVEAVLRTQKAGVARTNFTVE